MQRHRMKRLGRGTAEAFEVGDAVRVQDTHSGQWSVKGVISEVIKHDSSSSKTYQVIADSGAMYLRNGRYIKLRLSKMKRKKVSWDPSVQGGQ